MSDNGQKSRTWLWWIEVPVLMLLIYTFSVIPAVFIRDYLVDSGIVSLAKANRALDGIYAPVTHIRVLGTFLKSAIDFTDSLLP